jgi:hypothetical protein
MSSRLPFRLSSFRLSLFGQFVVTTPADGLLGTSSGSRFGPRGSRSGKLASS